MKLAVSQVLENTLKTASWVANQRSSQLWSRIFEINWRGICTDGGNHFLLDTFLLAKELQHPGLCMHLPAPSNAIGVC